MTKSEETPLKVSDKIACGVRKRVTPFTRMSVPDCRRHNAVKQWCRGNTHHDRSSHGFFGHAMAATDEWTFCQLGIDDGIFVDEVHQDCT